MRNFVAKAFFAFRLVFLADSTAWATFHEWRISEVYSNASGSVQFIEFMLPSSGIDNESSVGGQHITDSVLGHNFTIPSTLTSVPGVNGHFLVATPGYAILPGVPTPDYTFAANNFFSTSGDILTYSFVDTLSFSSTDLPTDGTHSLNRTSFGGSVFASQTASPTNLAEVTGQVPEPAALAGAVFLPVILVRRRSARFASQIARGEHKGRQ